jgi:hypothetical protein
MAVHSYGTTNIAWSSFDSWSNQYSSDSNVSFTTVVGGLQPSQTPPNKSVGGVLRSTSFLYGSVVAGTGGTVSVTSGYTQSAASSFTLANVDFSSIASITLTATATYPYTFHSWRTAASGGGSSLGTTGQGTTTGTLTLTSGVHTSVGTFYAYFTTTHVDP